MNTAHPHRTALLLILPTFAVVAGSVAFGLVQQSNATEARADAAAARTDLADTRADLDATTDQVDDLTTENDDLNEQVEVCTLSAKSARLLFSSAEHLLDSLEAYPYGSYDITLADDDIEKINRLWKDNGYTSGFAMWDACDVPGTSS